MNRHIVADYGPGADRDVSVKITPISGGPVARAVKPAGPRVVSAFRKSA
jgi:hypothetical protein